MNYLYILKEEELSTVKKGNVEYFEHNGEEIVVKRIKPVTKNLVISSDNHRVYISSRLMREIAMTFNVSKAVVVSVTCSQFKIILNTKKIKLNE